MKIMNRDFVLTIVFSNWLLSKIYDFFKDYLNATDDEICCSKIDRYKDKRTGEMRDSNRTLILMKRTLFNRALEAKLDLPNDILDFRISEYILTTRNYPDEGYCSNFYIILPKNVSTIEAEIALKEKFQALEIFGMIKSDDYSLKIPLFSRTTGEHRGFAYVSFKPLMDIFVLALIKVLFHDSFIHLPSIDKLYHLPLFWAKENKPIVPPPIYKILKR